MVQSQPVSVVTRDIPDRLVEAYRRAGMVAWDTETSGLDPLSDELQLCQLSARGVGTTLVQIDRGLPAGLIALLADPAVRVVMHHAPFDLLFMWVAWEVRATNIRCTKIASKLVAPQSPPSEHSLAALSSRMLGRSLTKGVVRTSNWGAAALSDEQIRYAAADVDHLLDLYDLLEGRLAEAGLSDLYDQCCDFLPTRTEVAALGISDVFAY